MIRSFVRTVSKARPALQLQQVRQYKGMYDMHDGPMDIKTEEWALFPRQREGNIYVHNWSLVEDGVVPTHDAYRNARVQLLTNAMGGKVRDDKVEATGPKYFGEFRVTEAGDDMTHEDFTTIFAAHQQHMQYHGPMYFEDCMFGSHPSARNGVRVISSVPATALIFRSLLHPSPPFEVNHRARFKGWNFDRRWQRNEPVWNSQTQSYDASNDLPKVAQLGQRPIVAFVGHENDTAAVQFVESNAEIVGANVVIGSKVPIRGIIQAMGHAACVLKNVQLPTAVTLPSTVLAKGRDTAVVLGGGEEVLDAAAKAGLLYGAYHNTISAEGISAVWGGYISSDPATFKASQLGANSAPVVVVDGKAAVQNSPNNLAYPAKRFVFYEKGATKGTLSTEEALKRLVALSEESKTEVLQRILQNANISVIGSPADVTAIL